MGGRGRGITGLCNLNRVNDGLAQLLQSPHGKRHLESSALSTAGLGEGGGAGIWGFDGSTSHTSPAGQQRCIM